MVKRKQKQKKEDPALKAVIILALLLCFFGIGTKNLLLAQASALGAIVLSVLGYIKK